MRKLFVLGLFCFLLSPAQARESVTSFLKRAVPGATPYDIRQVGSWAFCGLRYREEGEGQALIHLNGDRWELATEGGGALSARELATFGVPRQQWQKLTGRPVGKDDLDGANEVFSKPMWTWLTQDRQLKAADLKSYSALELILMRNEVFALHGRIFKDPYLKSVFATRRWYRPSASFSDASLSKRERANVAFISSYQAKSGKR